MIAYALYAYATLPIHPILFFIKLNRNGLSTSFYWSSFTSVSIRYPIWSTNHILILYTAIWNGISVKEKVLILADKTHFFYFLSHSSWNEHEVEYSQFTIKKNSPNSFKQWMNGWVVWKNIDWLTISYITRGHNIYRTFLDLTPFLNQHFLVQKRESKRAK